MTTNTKMMSKDHGSEMDQCIGCETGCDNDGAHRDESGNYHPECCTRAAELEKSTTTPSNLQHPASPYVVYGNTGPLPEPSSNQEIKTRKLKLEISAKRQAVTIIDYELKKTTLPKDEEHILPIPCFRTSPPIVCSNGEYYRFSNEEWTNAVNKAKEQYILDLWEK